MESKKPKTKKLDPDSRVTDLLRYFGEVYKVHIGEAYSFNFDRDGRNIKGMLSLWSEEQIRALIDHFFAFPSEYTIKKKYTFPVFFLQRNEIVQAVKERARKAREGDTRSAKYHHVEPIPETNETYRREVAQARQSGRLRGDDWGTITKEIEKIGEKYGIPKPE